MKIPLAFAILLSSLVAAQFTCSPTQPCAIGCCTKFGSCGLGPDSCGPENCISNCDRKSDCDPGWGSQWSTTTACPLNVCCSRFGFCGTTPEFCGNSTVTAPSCSGSSSSNRTIGYYEGWSIGRPCDKMYPEGIPIGAYTHLNFAFAFINPSTFAVAPMSPGDPELYTRFTALKNTNPGLQTWISIGGWSMNDPNQPTATTFSDLAGSADAQSRFFASTLSFLETYGFDGVDLDWVYPVASERSGKAADFQNYVTFLQDFRNALHSSGHSYGLTITIPLSYWYLQHFDIIQIEKTIDWFNVMSYDLHGTWDSTNKFLGSYIAAHTNLTEINIALSLLWRNNINPGNVVLGLGFYGRSFTLADPSCTTAGCVFTSGASGGQCTQSVGTLSYAEIQRIIAQGATVTKDDNAAVKMVVYNTNQWVSYDDEETLKMKVDYANAHCLGGTMVWAASTDDAKGSAASSLSKETGRQSISLLPSTLASNDSLVANFTRRIQAFASDPTCSAGQRHYSKRHPEAIAGNSSDILSNNLDKRSSLSSTDFTLLLQQLSQIILGGNQTYQQMLMATEFNTVYGDRFNVHIPDIGGFYDDWPNMDPLALTESLMCLGANASGFLSDYHRSRSQICVNSCTPSNATRRNNPNASFSVRNLGDSEFEEEGGPDGEPSWAYMVQGIIDGLMSLEYEQIILTSSGDTILEIVWNLPPGNGPGGINPNYQDHNPEDGQANPDRYVIFHFHTDHIARRGGLDLPGIHAVVAFHGQDYASPSQTAPHRPPRVDGNNLGGRNRRARMMNCNTGNPLFWYPGELTNAAAANLPLWARLMTAFANYMFFEDILTAATFTDSARGQLGLTPPDGANCNRRYFDWGRYRQSGQFGPDGSPPRGQPPSGPSGDGDDQQDNDGV